MQHREHPPLHVTTQGGFQLEVDGDLAAGRWSLAGDARVIAEGELFAGALASPTPPPWEEPAKFLQAEGSRRGPS